MTSLELAQNGVEAMQTISRLMGDHAVRQGIIFGCILGAFHILYAIINNLMNLQGSAYDQLNRSFLISLFLLLVLPGLLTGPAATGARAGFTAGLISALIGILSLWVITFLFMDVIAQNTYMITDFQKSGSATMGQFIVEDAMGATVVQLIASLVLGVALGFLGGWIGSVISRQYPRQAA